jgi:hypothetical protein
MTSHSRNSLISMTNMLILLIKTTPSSLENPTRNFYNKEMEKESLKNKKKLRRKMERAIRRNSILRSVSLRRLKSLKRT